MEPFIVIGIVIIVINNAYTGISFGMSNTYAHMHTHTHTILRHLARRIMMVYVCPARYLFRNYLNC